MFVRNRVYSVCLLLTLRPCIVIAGLVNLISIQCRLDIRKCSQRPVNEWNRLSADCVGVSCVNMFKNKIDIYLRRAGYI